MRKWHGGSYEHFGVMYHVGDVIGCFLDLFDCTISKFYISSLIRLFFLCDCQCISRLKCNIFQLNPPICNV